MTTAGRAHPVVYEVHARQWLAELGARDLAGVPDATLAALAALGVTHLWVMGAWCVGAAGKACARAHPGMRAAYDAALPGWTDADVDSSPYAVVDARVAPDLGGDPALAILRGRLARRGIGLILDFVPNHTARDHPWVRAHPERYVQAARASDEAFTAGDRVLAHGKDPYWPAWTDTAQLDHRRPDTRAAMRAVLRAIAGRCDGVRCDMAMLVLPDVFERTWGPGWVGDAFWPDAIAEVRATNPDFVFVAEAYWQLEARLCAQGFDYAYDKHLLDLLVDAHVPALVAHLRATDHAHRVHFLENHDEPRIAARLPLDVHRAAAVLALALPGMRLLHHGQLAGARVHAPIQLRRRAAAPVDPAVHAMYTQLLAALRASDVGQGAGTVLAARAAPHARTTPDGVAVVQWHDPAHPARFALVIVNLGATHAQARIVPTVPGLVGHTWHLADRLGDARWTQPGTDLATGGLSVELPPHGAYIIGAAAARGT